MNKFKEMKETHIDGFISIENLETLETHIDGFISIENLETVCTGKGDLGIQISEDGRVWICINGISLLRFKPEMEVR